MQDGTRVIVLAAGDGYGAGHAATTPALLREQRDREAALGSRSQVRRRRRRRGRHAGFRDNFSGAFRPFRIR